MSELLERKWDDWQILLIVCMHLFICSSDVYRIFRRPPNPTVRYLSGLQYAHSRHHRRRVFSGWIHVAVLAVYLSGHDRTQGQSLV